MKLHHIFITGCLLLIKFVAAHAQSPQEIVDPDCSNHVTYKFNDTSNLISNPSWSASTGESSTSEQIEMWWKSSGTVTVTFGYREAPQETQSATFTYIHADGIGGTISGPSSICEGDVAQLTVSGVSETATWQYCITGCSPTTDEGWTNTTSGSLAGLHATTSFRVKNNPFCKIYSNVKTVTVYPRPAPQISASSSVYNINSEEYRFTTESGMTNYTWALTGGTVVSGQQTNRVTVRWTAAGEQTISVSYTNTNGCAAGPTAMAVFIADNNYNWIRETTILTNGIRFENEINALQIATGEKSVTWSYFDGLGRSIQTNSIQGSPDKTDMIQPMAYDDLGREPIKYLPYVDESSTSGYFKTSALVRSTEGTAEQQYRTGKQFEFYQTGGVVATSEYPFAKTVFEANPLNRLIEQGAPGAPWQPDGTDSYTSTDNTIKMAYEFNTIEDNILLWTYAAPSPSYPLGEVSVTEPGSSAIKYYDRNELFKNKTKDEQGNEVIEYLDKEGKTLLKRVQAVAGSPVVNDINYASTYYIYNDLGSLACVIPPEATRRLSTAFYQSGADATSKNIFLSQWAFLYEYDDKKRMITKQVPGAEKVCMVYDNRDRLVLTQDAIQRAANQWSFTKYDALNRPIITGVYTHSGALNQADMSGQISTTQFFETYNGAGAHGYTDNVFPQGGTVHTVTYYDHYDFKTHLALGTAYNFVTNDIIGQETIASNQTIGLVTGTKINVLNTTDFLWAVNYYDKKSRPIQSIFTNHRGGINLATTILDFAGKTKKTKTTTREPGKSDIAVYRGFEYDHAGRLTDVFHRIGGNESDNLLLSKNVYNKLGQLVTKKLHLPNGAEVTPDPTVGEPGVVYASDIELTTYDPNVVAYVAKNSITIKPGFSVPAGGTLVARLGYSQADADAVNGFAQEMDFRYNIRGWLENINDVDESGSKDLFSMDLNYNNPLTNGGVPQYNGNISQARWKGPDGEHRSYGYYYDPMNRLLKGKYFSLSTPITNGRFDEKIGHETDVNKPAYDLNGNIRNLFRNGKNGVNALGITTYGAMDALSYDYTGNQLNRVTDGEVDTEGFKEGANSDDDYAYDTNGNMRMDKNKSLNDNNSIVYNHLNLPSLVQKSPTEYVQYVYDATGRKLRQVAVEQATKTTDYVGEFIYENNVLQFINHEEGRIVMTGSTPEYQYHLKDHLGNVRTTFTTKEETEAPLATLETIKESDERADFLKYDDVRKVNHPLFDHTNTGDTKNAIRLTGTDEETYGLARSIAVMPGDKIQAEVYAKYVDPNQDNSQGFITTLLSQINSETPGLVLDGAAYGTPAGMTIPFVGLLSRETSTEVVPKAYLTWLVFDKDHNFILEKSWYKRVTNAAKESGANVSAQTPEGKGHELVQSPVIEIEQAGYVYIYFSNEEEGYEVYFDDFKVEQVKSNVVQSDDYYPFGLTFNSFSREHSVHNLYQYNGKEKQDELGLEWLDYGARMYMSDIARWGVGDPLADKRNWITPYNYVQNNPIIRVDPTGALDVYGMDTGTGKINLIKKTNDKTDKLIDNRSGKVIASKVNKGLLKDGQNIKQNGLETKDAKGGTKLAVKISFHTEHEIQGTIYKNSSGESYLKVDPYYTAKKVIGKDNGDFFMTTGQSGEVQKNFTSSDGSFSGTAAYFWHTHPGWTGFPQFGTPEASHADDEVIMQNKIQNGITIPFYIYSKNKMSDGKGTTSNVSVNQFNTGPWGGVNHRLLPQKYGIEEESD